MSGLVSLSLAYAAGALSAVFVFAVFHAGGNRQAEEELEAKELAAMKASRASPKSDRPSAA
jgi:hypothetical protein